jgi:hypothetical protein
MKERMVQTEEFKTVSQFLEYCYHRCQIGQNEVTKLGCILRCELRMELRKLHPEWFGKARLR